MSVFFNILNPRQVTVILILLYENCCTSIQIAATKLLGIIQDKYCKTVFDETEICDPRGMDLKRYTVNFDVFDRLPDLTHWGRDQIDAISQTTFSNAFSRMKMNEFRLGFH